MTDLPTPATADVVAPPPPLRGKIRPLTDEDVKLFLVDLEHRHGGEDHWTSRQFQLRRRRNHGMMVFACDRSVVGYLAFVLSARTAVVTRLLVHPSVRRRGVGRRLLARLADLAANRPVCTRVREDQLDTLKFLRACGIAESFESGPSDGLRDVTVRMKPPARV